MICKKPDDIVKWSRPFFPAADNICSSILVRDATFLCLAELAHCNRPILLDATTLVEAGEPELLPPPPPFWPSLKLGGSSVWLYHKDPF